MQKWPCTPFQNQGAWTDRKVAQVFQRKVHQNVYFRSLMKFTYRFSWAGYVKKPRNPVFHRKSHIFEKMRLKNSFFDQKIPKIGKK